MGYNEEQRMRCVDAAIRAGAAPDGVLPLAREIQAFVTASDDMLSGSPLKFDVPDRRVRKLADRGVL